MQKKTVMVAVAILATLLAGCGDKKSEPAPVAAPAAVTAPAPAAAPAAPAAAPTAAPRRRPPEAELVLALWLAATL